jgi:hypothetical protein
MILVIDANAIIPNPELVGSTWEDITAAITEGVLEVIVPQIVVAEITGRVRAIRRAQRPRTDGTHGIPQGVQDAVQAARDEVERWAAQYNAATFLAAAGAEVRETPTVSHDVLAQRAIDRVPPFNANGGGYRDTLHWYTVLEVIAEHPDEEIVLLSNDNGYKNKAQDDLHERLRKEAEEALGGGSISFCQELKEFAPPRKFAGNEIRAFLADDHVHELMAALFLDGKLHAPDLWHKLGLDDPVDADVTNPGDPEVVFSYVRDLVDGGDWYRTRLRLTARVVFDWVDWAKDDDVEGSEEQLDITVWYTVDDDGFHVDPDRTDLQPAPIYSAPRLDFLDPEITRSLTSSAFSAWKNQQFGAAILAAQGVALPKFGLAPATGTMIGEIIRQGFRPNFTLGTEIAQHAALGTSIGSIGTAIARAGALGNPAGASISTAGRQAARDQLDAEDQLDQFDEQHPDDE